MMDRDSRPMLCCCWIRIPRSICDQVEEEVAAVADMVYTAVVAAVAVVDKVVVETVVEVWEMYIPWVGNRSSLQGEIQ
jgi:hypothetical protein